jgi:hypothetical protein
MPPKPQAQVPLKRKPRTKGRQSSPNGHEQVQRLPRVPGYGISYWLESPNGRHEFTHQLMRFPAKFHLPVVRWALGQYGRKGSVLLDPFTGSGTAQVEALARGISSVGVDIDPLACLIARAKTKPISPNVLDQSLTQIKELLESYADLHADRERREAADISEQRYLADIVGLTIPPIPNITHWFRRYVIVDLARIKWAIEQAAIGKAEKQFFMACFAGIIRRVSNADPDPVSGLEVTSVQVERNKKRKIAVYSVFLEKCRFAIDGMEQLWEAYKMYTPAPRTRIIQGDTQNLANLLDAISFTEDGYPLVVTSPPYCRAVEYSRRHQLEMYWLDHVRNAAEHVELSHTYLGRKLVRVGDWEETGEFGISRLDSALDHINKHDTHKARTVRHYFRSMHSVMKLLSEVMSRRGTFVCVIGDSVCCKVPIATSDFIAELASGYFVLKNRFSYALRNQYMQYGLWNGTGIKQEHVLVMKPR